MTGEIGRYLYSFGITSAVAILLSMFVSFTLTPALCAMLDEGNGRRHRPYGGDSVGPHTPGSIACTGTC